MNENLSVPDDKIKPLVHSLNIGVLQCETGAEGKITFINQTAAEILAFSPSEDVSNLLLRDYFENPDDYSEWMQNHTESNPKFESNIQCKKKDGNIHTIKIISNLILDSEGKSIRIDCALEDVHLSKKEELEKDIVSNINRILISNLDMRKVYHLICGELQKMIKWDRVAITLLGDNNNDAVVNYTLTKRAFKESGRVSQKMSENRHIPLEGSILGEIVKSGEPYIVKDTLSSVMETDKVYGASGIRSRLGYPLSFKGKIIGSINFGYEHVDYYNDDHINLLSKIASSLAFGIENTEELDARLEHEVVANVNKILVSNLNMKEVDHVICDELGKIIEWDRVSITLLENKTEMEISFVLNKDKKGKKGALSKEMPEKSYYPLLGSVLEKVVKSGKPFIVEDTTKGETATDKIYAKDGLMSRLAYPLEFNNEIIGSINFGCSKPNYYGKDHLKLLEQIATSLAFGIENCKLYERATKAETEVKNLSETIDSPWG